MQSIDTLLAIEAVRRLKARYLRGVDTGDGQLVRDILAESCVLDYRDCFKDRESGEDYFPAMSIVLRNRSSWSDGGLCHMGYTTIHQTHQCEIDIISGTAASAIWAMTDRIYMPAGSPYTQVWGYGYYRETYIHENGHWLLDTLKLERLRVGATPAHQ